MIPRAYVEAQRSLEALPSIAGYMKRIQDPVFYLERTKILLRELGNPEKNFSYIHVGGTAGKGSVTLFIHHILKAAGKRTGAFISPHVTTPAERTLINARPVSAQDFVWAWKRLQPHITRIRARHGNAYAPSYFEAHFAMSILLFQKYRVDWAVVEVGCGGAYDATNTIPSPQAAVLTNVHLDHTQLLGRTRKQIARTKSGIAKRGSHLFTGEPDQEVRHVIRTRTHAVGCSFSYIPTKKRSYTLSKRKMVWSTSGYPTLVSQLLGAHQIHNAEIAIRVCEHLGISKTAIRKGISSARMPARSEFLQVKPDVMIDGAHNPFKMKALVSLLADFNYPRIHAIVGIGAQKPAKQILRALLPYVASITFTKSSVSMPEAENPSTLLGLAKSIAKKKRYAVHPNPEKAIKDTLKLAHKDDLVLITGSLYLAGEVREYWIPEARILKKRNLFPQ